MDQPTDAINHLEASWLDNIEGQLSVDVLENEKEVIVRSAIAGVSSDDLDISLSQDTLTIRGERGHHCEERDEDTIHVQECHWGAFSRSIILPSHVDPDSAQASLKQGILTIVMNKTEIEKKIAVLQVEDL